MGWGGGSAGPWRARRRHSGQHLRHLRHLRQKAERRVDAPLTKTRAGADTSKERARSDANPKSHPISQLAAASVASVVMQHDAGKVPVRVLSSSACQCTFFLLIAAYARVHGAGDVLQPRVHASSSLCTSTLLASRHTTPEEPTNPRACLPAGAALTTDGATRRPLPLQPASLPPPACSASRWRCGRAGRSPCRVLRVVAAAACCSTYTTIMAPPAVTWATMHPDAHAYALAWGTAAR